MLLFFLLFFKQKTMFLVKGESLVFLLDGLATEYPAGLYGFFLLLSEIAANFRFIGFCIKGNGNSEGFHHRKGFCLQIAGLNCWD